MIFNLTACLLIRYDAPTSLKEVTHHKQLTKYRNKLNKPPILHTNIREVDQHIGVRFSIMNMNNNNQPEVLPQPRSKQSCHIIPASHWISIGYSEEDAWLMEKLQTDIKNYCEINNDDTKIDLRGKIEEPGVILPYHDMLLPHWQKLFKALNGRTSSIKAMSLMGISLPTTVLDIMFSASKSINLEEFATVSVGLGRDGFLKLSSFIRENTSLKNLTIGGDLIDDLSVASSISYAIENHPTLELLILAACGLNNAGILGNILEGCKRLDNLSIAKCNSPELVSLSNEELGMEGVGLLADFIRGNHSTKCLVLVSNNLSDNDALVLAAALKENTNLRWLKLEKNNITEDGEKKLLKALYDPTSMDSIIESNHTCLPFTYDLSNSSTRPFLELELFMINMNDDISVKQKIRKKVVLALCGVEGELFDLSYFNDLPLGVMPRVLELIQEHTDMRTKVCHSHSHRIPDQLEKDALTRLFHTLRGWELPLLFENLNRQSTNAGETKKKQSRRLIEDLDNLKIL